VKYEVRMSVLFRFEPIGSGTVAKQSTMIEYLDAENIGEAYIKAAKLKHDVVMRIMKESQSGHWESKIKRVEVGIDAVVAKPELVDRLVK